MDKLLGLSLLGEIVVGCWFTLVTVGVGVAAVVREQKCQACACDTNGFE